MEIILEEAVEVLVRTPAVLRSMLKGLSDPWIYQNEGPDTWSPYDIVGHLIHGEDTDWIPRAKIIIEHGESLPFTPFDRFAFFEKSKEKSLEELLDIFETKRNENLWELETLELTPEKFALRGTHPEFGPVTLGQLIATWVAHDLSHIYQITRAMANRYKEAAGPWTAYLSILQNNN